MIQLETKTKFIFDDGENILIKIQNEEQIYPLGEYFILSSRGYNPEIVAKCGNYVVSKKSRSLVIDINFKERKLEKITRYLYYELRLVDNS